MPPLVAAHPEHLVRFAAATAGPIEALAGHDGSLAAAVAGARRALGTRLRPTPIEAGRLAAHAGAVDRVARSVAAVGLALAAAGGADPGVVRRALRLLPDDDVAPVVAAALGLRLDAPVGATSAVDPDDVARLAALLGRAATTTLAREHPTLVASIDGMPPEARYAANRVLLRRAVAAAEAGGDHERAADLQALLRPGRQVLVFDPAGDGRVAEVLGDLATARAVAVVVPGMGNALANYERQTLPKAEAVLAAAGSGTAVVAWLGYDSPEGASAVLDDASLDAGGRLVRLLDGVPSDARRTAVGHSYGSVVVAQALRRGLDVDGVVVTGSPGMLEATADELGGVPIWAARAPFDAIGWSEAFGRDPTDPRFGATELATGPMVWHSSYFAPGSESLTNIGHVVAGRTAHVTVAEPPAVEVMIGIVEDLQRRLDPTDAAQAAARRVAGDLDRLLDDLDPVLPEPVADVVDRAQVVGATALEVGDRAVDVAQRLTSVDLWGDVAGDAAQALGDLLR